MQIKRSPTMPGGLALLACVLAGAASEELGLAVTPSKAARLQQLRSLAAPDLDGRSVHSAKAHHQEALRRIGAIGRLLGHEPMRMEPLEPSCGPQKAGTINPIDFGADPTGTEDSSPAFARALAVMLNSSTHTHAMAADIVDLGGATMDLGGGEYLISEPLVVPPFFGNLHFRSGTLRAADTFPKDKFLVMVGDMACVPKLPTGKVDGQESCVEFISFSDMLFDAAHVASGGLYIAKAMGATVGPSAFFVGFKDFGVKVDQGHEVMILESWLAECYWSQFSPLASFDPCSPEWSSDSIGIQVTGQDAQLSNVIVFGFTRTGVKINGHCNILYGVHTWNSAPLPPTLKQGVGISLGSTEAIANEHNANRIIGCYLDYNTLDLYDPQDTLVESSFFLGTHTNLLPLQGSIKGLIMRHNTFSTGKSVELSGSFKSVKDVVISDQINAKKSTRARMSLYQKSSTRWEFDFQHALIFPEIEQVTYSVSSDGPFFHHLARTPQGLKVVIETNVSVDATVVVEAVQGIDQRFSSLLV